MTNVRFLHTLLHLLILTIYKLQFHHCVSSLFFEFERLETATFDSILTYNIEHLNVILRFNI